MAINFVSLKITVVRQQLVWSQFRAEKQDHMLFRNILCLRDTTFSVNLEYLLYLLRQPLAVCLVPIRGICSSMESDFHAAEKKGMEISSGQPQKLPLNIISVII